MDHESLMELIYMLINFVILFGALFLIAGKMVKSGFKKRADDIAESLKKSEEASSNAKKYLASASQVDEVAAEKRELILSDAQNMILKNSVESAQACEEEKENILQDAEEVKGLMAAGMHNRVYAGAMERLTDSVENLLSNEKFADAKKNLQARFIPDVKALLEPSETDIVNMVDQKGVDVIISGCEEVDADYMEKIHDMVADNFFTCEFETDENLGDEMQIEFQDRVYRGTMESIIEAMERDSYRNSGLNAMPIDVALMTDKMDDDDINTLRKLISNNFINIDYETKKGQADEVELQFGNKVFRGSFDVVMDQISAELA